MRSLVYAMLNHQGEPNPAQSDLDADRAGRLNWQLRQQIGEHWNQGTVDENATQDLIQALHECSPQQASEKVVQLLHDGIAVQSVWDALFCSAGELLMRQRGIVALHAVTTANAMHYAFRHSGDDATRQFLLLQCAAFVPQFRQAALDRGKLADRHIDQLSADQGEAGSGVAEIFELLGQNREEASLQLYRYLAAGGAVQSVVDHARRLVFLKGDDSHDYKFSSAALEDYRVLSPAWRDRFLAASSYQLRSSTEPTRDLVTRIQNAIAS
jgi:hypothetical protein